MGYEYTHSYRTLLHLSDRLARAGLPTLRFDYHGAGASPGDALTSGLLDKWVENVHAGVRLMQDITGREVSLLGLRLGAALAGVAASRFDIDHLVAWAPVVSGRSFARELDAMAKIAGATRTAGAEYLEAGGFILSDETAEDLKTLKLDGLEYRIQGEALILERDDLPTPPKLASALSARGVHVDVLEAPGYAGMMDEPHYTVVPDSALCMITDWLSERTPFDTAARVKSDEPEPLGGDGPEQDFGREELVQLEGGTRLFAVHTTPTGELPPERTLLILSNSGSVHQVGPNRVYVELSRALARAGIPSLRLDLRNLGDSIRCGPEEENHPYPGTAVEDLGLAMEWARREHGYRRVVIGGICSGAYHAFRAGLELDDPVLVGALIINPLTFDRKEGQSLALPPAFQTISDAKHYESAMRDPKKWLRLLRGDANLRYIAGFLFRHAADTGKRLLDDALEGLRLRAPERLAKELVRLRASGRHADFVFSSSDPGYGILTAQAGRTLRKLNKTGATSLSFIAQADHTFSRREWRDALAETCIARMRAYEDGIST
jgi:predicted alpha/beta hydrolase